MLRFFSRVLLLPNTHNIIIYIYIISSYKNGAHTEPSKKFFGFWDDEKLAIFLLDNFFILFFIISLAGCFIKCFQSFFSCVLFEFFYYFFFGRFHRKIYLHFQNLNLSHIHTHMFLHEEIHLLSLKTFFFLFLHIFFIIFKIFGILHKNKLGDF